MQNLVGSYKSVQNLVGSCKSVQNLVGSYKSVQNLVGSYKSVQILENLVGFWNCAIPETFPVSFLLGFARISRNLSGFCTQFFRDFLRGLHGVAGFLVGKGKSFPGFFVGFARICGIICRKNKIFKKYIYNIFYQFQNVQKGVLFFRKTK